MIPEHASQLIRDFRNLSDQLEGEGPDDYPALLDRVQELGYENIHEAVSWSARVPIIRPQY